MAEEMANGGHASKPELSADIDDALYQIKGCITLLTALSIAGEAGKLKYSDWALLLISETLEKAMSTIDEATA